MKPINAMQSLGIALALLFTLAIGQTSAADVQPNLQSQIGAIAEQWARIQYQTNGVRARLQALDALETELAAIEQQYPSSAEAKIWLGIVLATHAGLDGGIGALKRVKRARRLFERAIEIDETALGASAHASLGTLYYKVPPWPIAFGSNRKARRHLERALALNPGSIDGNFFMAGFLEKIGEHQRAIKVLKFAAGLPDRPGRPIADAGRRDEIAVAMKRVRELAALN